jgi:hypothetical protein
MPRLAATLSAVVVLVCLGIAAAPGAEDRLVIYTAYEENELKTFWEQFQKDVPDLAAKA